MYSDSESQHRAIEDTERLARYHLSRDFVFIFQNVSVRHVAEAVIDVLRGANLLLGRDAYRWQSLHLDEIGTLSAETLQRNAVTVVLVGGLEAPWHLDRETLLSLSSVLSASLRVCAIGSAILVLSQARMLKSKRVAVHPNFRTTLLEGKDTPLISHRTHYHHSTLSSAISPVAGVRMVVDLVGALEGEYTRRCLSDYLGLEDQRQTEALGEYWQFRRKAEGDRMICAALSLMQENLEDTISIAQVAQLLDISRRSLERRFNDMIGRSPLQVYRSLRLERARRLVMQSTMTFTEIAIACGFSNSGLMYKWYQETFSEVPMTTRKRYYGAV